MAAAGVANATSTLAVTSDVNVGDSALAMGAADISSVAGAKARLPDIDTDVTGIGAGAATGLVGRVEATRIG